MTSHKIKLTMFSQGPCWNKSAADETLVWEILIDVYIIDKCNFLISGPRVVFCVCVGHPSCHCDWCMGSLCVPLSYLSEGSAVHFGACLRHHACGCPPSEAIGCERDGGLCLKGSEARPGGRRGAELDHIWDTTVTWLVTQNSISQTWDFVNGIYGAPDVPNDFFLNIVW